MKRKIFLQTQEITPVLFAPDDTSFYSKFDQLKTNMNCQEKNVDLWHASFRHFMLLKPISVLFLLYFFSHDFFPQHFLLLSVLFFFSIVITGYFFVLFENVDGTTFFFSRGVCYSVLL